tara:strand:- start:29 stop:523 length:495 start_codon:yes stop_codon:yes gene_type:complete
MEIVGYENYLIYNDGRCLSKARNKNYNTKAISQEMFLKPRLRKNYYAYMLFKEGVGKAFSIHRLVALHYISNPNNYKVVNHIDSNTSNNDMNNLEWCSDIYNAQSFNKINSNIGTITTYRGVRKTTYRGQVRLYGKYYYTKSFDNKEIVQEELNKIVDSFRNNI